MKKKLSIIVPVYNVEKYLEACVNSIISNNFIDYEIILVNDGSTDKSGEICNELLKKFPKIVSIIHKENGGLSSARNAGIKKANGKYLMFVDSDDLLANVSLGNLLSKDYDIIQYKMIYYYEESKKYVKLKDIVDKGIDEPKINLLEQIKNGTLSISACDKIIKKDLITSNNLYFNEQLLSEDIDWSLNLYQFVKKIKILNKDIYIYRQQRKNSITNKVTSRSISSMLYIIDKWLNFNYFDAEFKKIYKQYLAYLYTILLTTSSFKNTTRQQRLQIKKMRFLLKYDCNYKVKMCNNIFKVFGFGIGKMILKFYLILKNKGIIKL